MRVVRLSGASPAPRDRPRLIDLNLVPRAYRYPGFPILTAALSLLFLGSLLLFGMALSARTSSEQEVAQLRGRVSQARAISLPVADDPTAIAQRNRLRAMRDDYRLLLERQIHWGDVFQTIADVPGGVTVRSVEQAGHEVIVAGLAQNSDVAARYLDQLRASGLFGEALIQIKPSSGMTTGNGGTTVPSGSPGLPGPPGTAPIATALTPSPGQVPFSSAPLPRPSRSTPAPLESQTRTTRTPMATPTPTFDLVVVSIRQIPVANPRAPTSEISGWVLDKDGNPMSGVTLQVRSDGRPPWSATTVSDAQGAFDFSVTHGKFDVFAVGGRAQHARNLYTGADGVAGVFSYQVIFQATFSGAIPLVVGTETVTPTLTMVPTEMPTPISPGVNVASLGCASAYLVQNGATKPVPGSSNPGLAIDGDLATEWNAGLAPGNGTAVIWQWSLPAPGQSVPGCTAAGLPDAQDQIDGIQLIPDQTPAGPTVHELWLYTDSACTSNVAATNTAYYTFQQTTSAGQVLPLRLRPALPIRCVLIRTLSDPSFVAWQEVQIFQGLPPPGGIPTTPAASTTPTITPLPPYPGENVAPYAGLLEWTDQDPRTYAGSATCSTLPPPPSGGSSKPCATIDGDLATYWIPSAGAANPQTLAVHLPSGHFLQGTDVIADVRLGLQVSGSGSWEIYQVLVGGESSGTLICQLTTAGLPDGTWLDCPLPSPTPGPDTVYLRMSHPSSGGTPIADGSYRIREIQIYTTGSIPRPPTVTPTLTFTPTPSSTPTLTATAGFSATSTLTATALPSLTASMTPLATGTSTLTLTPTPTATWTPTATITSTPIPTMTRTPTAAPTPTATATAGGLTLGPGAERWMLPLGGSPGGPDGPPPEAPVEFTIILKVAAGRGYP